MRVFTHRCLIAIAISLLGASLTIAQQGRFGIAFQQNMSRFIPPPRAITQQLKEAERAIAEERYSDAVVVLGDVLERVPDPGDEQSLAGQDFFLEAEEENQPRRDQSFLKHCRNLIGSLPAKGRETYELRYGALAEQLLGDATTTRDWNKLREVRRRYFHTEAGYNASLLLAQHEMFLGHPLAASLLLDDVVASKAAVEQLGREVVLLHAVACQVSARSPATGLSELPAELRVGESDGNPSVSDWRSWIEKNYQLPSSDAISRSADYPYLGGGASRNDGADGQLPLSTPRWMLETTATPREEQALRLRGEELASSGRLIPPSWTPIRVGDQLLMRTTERLMGVDFRTGKRVWQYPWFQSDDSFEQEQSLTSRGGGQDEGDDLLERRVWNDLPYGQLSSDGERVYLLDDLSPVQTVQINPLMGIQNIESADSDRNTLVALELKTEGKTLWRLGQDPTIASELNEAFFLGPPLPVDGSLYAIVEMAGDISLVCLDPATGNMRWRQQLVAIEGLGIQYDASRRTAGAAPTYHEGVLICPTGAGATVAVDLGDRTLRWGNTYERRAESNALGRFQRAGDSPDELLERWHHSLAVASGNSVLVTPVVTDVLYCFDLVDGKRRFNKPRLGAFYVAGIRDGKLFVIGARELRCYDLQNGRLQWTTDAKLIAPGQQIVGRGVFGPDRYIVPTSGNELISVSIEDGSELQRRTTRYPLGNLVAVDGELISQGPTTLAVAFGARTLGPKVDRMLEENPNNLDALIQKALLLTEQGNRQEALTVLQKAREIEPDSDEVLILSIAAMLGVLREEESPSPALVKELDALIDTPAQRMEFLALRIQSALRERSVRQATELLLEFSSVIGNVNLLGNEDESILRDPMRDCNLDSWTSARSAELARIAAEEGQSELVQELLAEHIQEKRRGSSRLLESMVEHFRPLGVDSLIVSLAARRMAEGLPAAAERLLLGPIRPARLLNLGQLPFSQERAVELARVYAEGQLAEDSLEILDVVQARQPQDDSEGDGERVVTPSSLDEIREKAKAAVELDGEALDVTAPVSLTWQTQAMPGGARAQALQHSVEPEMMAGQSFQGWSLINNSGAVMLQNPLGESRRVALEAFPRRNVSDRDAAISGGIMIMERPGQLSAVDLFAIRTNQPSEAVIWTRDFGSEGDASTARKSRVTEFGDTISSYPTNSASANMIGEFRVGPVLGDRVVVLQAGDLVAIRLTDKNTLWRHSGAPTTGHLVADADRVAVVSNPINQPATVTTFDLLDGRKLDSQPWKYGTLWSSIGSCVLAYETSSKSATATVRLVNPLAAPEERVLLETEALVKSPQVAGTGRGFGRVLQDRYLVLFDTTGRLVVWDLLRGTELCRHEVGEMPELQYMHAMWMDGQLLVMPANEVQRQNASDMTTQQGDVHRTVHKIIAVSTESGDINWQRDFDEPWGCTLSQPHGSPVLVLVRAKTIFSTNRSSRTEMDVQMLRLTDGETIYEELQKSLAGRAAGLTTALIVQPRQNRVLVRIEGEALNFEFGSPPNPDQ
ncbi:PQQ-binding-like beta-propeller repeat protein [Roseiconus nitratireducens]|uniref:PQQ-binding-like beta-propeller repeat protein n=1 Tax=Roseiconus nitratireducens TaxID=2605748 RepID=A0A5M6CYP3_9BACT|nr:PQQ-binding-like beta-propeller repeat protein [Roseiconus nitratireducens]KAA5540223.1 PQQ-binding-like beta-propeller repeat protein [Roseiconus nitratireducens]